MTRLMLLVKSVVLCVMSVKAKESIPISILKKVVELTKPLQRINNFSEEKNDIGMLRELLNEILADQTLANEEILLSLEMVLVDNGSIDRGIFRHFTTTRPKEVASLLLKEINKEVKKMSSISLLRLGLAKLNNPSTTPDLVMGELASEANNIIGLTNLDNRGLVDEVDFSNKASVNSASEKATKLMNTANLLATDWGMFNEMMQGGLPRGAMVSIGALPHNNKSGLTKSLFLQLSMYNKPILTDKTKRPLMVFISLEENVDNITMFIYIYLKHTIDGIELKTEDIKKTDPSVITEYIYEKMNGVDAYEIKVYRFKPELLTFTVLFKLVSDLEAKGFEVHGVFMDYLSKMNREGCLSTGPMGADLLDLYSRVRNEFSAKEILFVSPIQISTSGKALLRLGLSPNEFLDKINGGGYYAGSSAVDTELDIELNIYKYYDSGTGDTFIQIKRGKDRRPGIIPVSKQNFFLKFTSTVAPLRGVLEAERVNKRIANGELEQVHMNIPKVEFRELPGFSDMDAF